MAAVTMPPHSPQFFYRIAKSTYRGKQAKYLKKHLSSVELVDQFVTSGDWKVCLYKVGDSDYGLGCRGTVVKIGDLRNIFSIVGHELTKWSASRGQMKKVIKGWKKTFGPMSWITGHSAGGFFACRLADDCDIPSCVTFNGHACLAGQQFINLRTEDDFASRDSSKIDRYTTVGPGHHSLSDFKSSIKRPWHEVAPTLFPASETAVEDCVDCESSSGS